MLMFFGGFMGWWKSTTCDDICMKWIIDLNIGINHLGFELNVQHVWPKHKNMKIGLNVFVTHETYFVVVARAK
jgi:hypothetical protein